MLGELLFVFYICITCIAVAAFMVLMTAYMVDSVADMLGVTWQEVMYAVVILAFVGFFAWFILGFPGMPKRAKPHAVEGREYWIDLREGTSYYEGDERLEVTVHDKRLDD